MKKIIFLLLISALFLASCDDEPRKNTVNDDVIWVEDGVVEEDEGEHYTGAYDKDGNWTMYRTETEYDKKGNEILEILYDDNGDIFRKVEHEYDEKGKNTVSAYYDYNGNIYRKFEYTYE